MSQDGADIGVGAEKAVEAVLGGDQPKEEDKETVDEMRKRILDAPIVGDLSYDGCATACAGIVLRAYIVYPQLVDIPMEVTYLIDSGGNWVMSGEDLDVPIRVTVDLYQTIKKLYREDSDEHKVFLELTGFMWGWAVNAARRCIGASPVSNPAIVTFGGDKE